MEAEDVSMAHTYNGKLPEYMYAPGNLMAWWFLGFLQWWISNRNTFSCKSCLSAWLESLGAEVSAIYIGLISNDVSEDLGSLFSYVYW